MQTRRLTAWCALSLALLGGCSDGPEERTKLHREIVELKQQLASRTAERSAELAYHERQAAIAAGCDWAVPTCPERVVKPGRQAQAAGFGGGGDLLLWTIVLLKVLIAAAGGGVLLLTLALGWEWRLRPSRAQVHAAQKLVEEARSDARRLTNTAERDLVALNHAIFDAKAQLGALESEIAILQAEAARQAERLDRKLKDLAIADEARRALNQV